MAKNSGNVNGSTMNGSKNAILSLAVIIATASIFGLTYSLTAPLVAHLLLEQGAEESTIGLNAAMHAIGVLCIAPFLSRLTVSFGLKSLIIGALIATAILLGLFPIFPVLLVWFLLRFCLGVAAEILFVLTETWCSELSNDSNRGRIMATYTASLSIGFAGGPLILSLTGFDGKAPFFAGAAIAAIAAVIFCLPRLQKPAETHHESPNILRSMRLSPVAMGTTSLNAGIETAGLTFLTIYAVRLGWSEIEGAQLIAVLMFGAVFLQIPIGWLSDKVDRYKLMLVLTAISALTAFLWPVLLASPWLAYPALFIWGGMFVGIYTSMLAIIGAKFRGPDLVSVYAAMGIFWGAGALVGPLLAGGFVDYMQHGLPIFVGSVCAAFFLFLIAVRRTISN